MTGKELKEAGIEQVDSNTPEQWKIDADSVIMSMASSGREFTAEDVRCFVGDPPNHPNAFGARFNSASKAGIIKRVGYKQASRNSAHARVIAVYVGRVFDR